MGRWDSPSPTRARARSPRERKDEKPARKSRWEDDDDDKVESEGKEVIRRDRRRHDDKDGDRERRRDRSRDRRRRRDDDRSRQNRRSRSRGEDRGTRDRSRDKDRRTRDRSRDKGRSRRHRSRSPSKDKEGKEERIEGEEPEAPPKEAPNFARTTHLVSETNTLNGVVLKYVEPSESRLPTKPYRLFVFKSSDLLSTLTLSSRTAWLIGRDHLVCDLPIDHPSCSKQHAVIQFRFISAVNEWGERKGEVKPYIIDLGSANGTKVNGVEVPKERYYELREKDVISFGHSTREYVLMIEK